jgi:threonine aldolase
MTKIGSKCRFGFWERLDENRCVVRFATSFATAKEDIDELAKII